MYKERLLAALAALALMIACASAVSAQAFEVEGRALTADEGLALMGGETYVAVDTTRTTAVVTTIPRDSYGMDYSRASSYTVPVKNALVPEKQDGGADLYDPAPFPSGTATLDVKEPDTQVKKDRYGGSSGQWITSDASRRVTAYPKGPDGEPIPGDMYTRRDWGYFWHANNRTKFEDAKSAGCLLSPKPCLDRVIATLKADRGRKTIFVP